MHYANGREAKNGDKIVFFGYGNPVIGILYNAQAGNNFCNGNIAVTKPNDPCPNLVECLHVDDIVGLLPDNSLSENKMTLQARLQLVPDSSKVQP